MTLDEIKKVFRTPAAGDYPELQGYPRAAIYEGKMGPGGLYLAAQMARRMSLVQGQRVLDLGCGQGASSAFLAKEYGVFVVAVDLWIGATTLHERFQRLAVGDRIVPLNLDITGPLPFARDYFDAVFCMDSVHYYGGNLGFWEHLLPHLKHRGSLCIGSPCFTAEFSTASLLALPTVYDDGTDLWPKEFSRYHSPGWWADLLRQTGYVEVRESNELADGIVFWEDDVLHNIEQGGSTTDAERDAAQITYRQDGMPYLTHFVLCAEKKAQPGAPPSGPLAGESALPQ